MTRKTLAITLLVLGAAAQEPGTPRGGRVAWRTDLDGALLDARKAHRPVMIYFTHDR